MLSVENLEPGLKAKYKQLAIFLDDVVIPTKVSSGVMSQNRSYWHRVPISVQLLGNLGSFSFGIMFGT